MSNFHEQQWTKLRLRGHDYLVIGCIYRSPSGNQLDSTSRLCELMKSISDTNPSHLVLVGDFNYRDIDWTHCYSTACINHHSHQFVNTIQDCYLVQHVTEPTRYRSDSSPHTLDLIFSNEPNMISDLQYLPGLGHSDHICLKFNIECYTIHTMPCNTKLNLNRGDYEGMRNKIDRFDWEASMED